MRIRQALPEDMAAVAELSRELAAHVNDPDPGSDYSVLVDCAFGLERWFECLVAEEANCMLTSRSFAEVAHHIRLDVNGKYFAFERPAPMQSKWLWPWQDRPLTEYAQRPWRQLLPATTPRYQTSTG